MMLAVSFKTNKKTVAAAAILLLLLGAAALLVFSPGKPQEPRPAGNTESITQESRQTPAIGSRAETPAEIRTFLAAFGWETAEEPEEIIEVLIPVQFDEVMEHYNAIQRAQGGDLTRYRGKTVQRYTFRVTNHPHGEAVRANVLLCNGRIIGGDVCSLELNGFMHGFLR